MRQAPLSMGFPRQEYWGGLPFPSPGEGLGEQQSTRPDQLPLCPFRPPSLAHSLFLSIQPLSKGHPCHLLLLLISAYMLLPHRPSLSCIKPPFCLPHHMTSHMLPFNYQCYIHLYFGTPSATSVGTLFCSLLYFSA